MRGSQISQRLLVAPADVVIDDSDIPPAPANPAPANRLPPVKALKTLMRARSKAKHLHRAAIQPKKWKVKEFVLGTAVGQSVALVFLAVWLILLGAWAWMLAGGTDDYGSTFREGMWLSWGVFFDPGTQTGLSATEKLGPQFIAVLFSVGGFMFNLVALGIIVDIARNKLEQWKTLYGRLVLNNHIVVLGWTDKTVFLLTELAEMLQGNKTRKRVAVLADKPLEEMLLEVETHLPDFRHRIDLVQGKPFEVDSLDRVCIETSSVVVLLGASKQPDVADSLSVTTLLALHSLPVTPQALLIAELQLAQSVDVVSGIFGTGRMSFEVIGVTTSSIADQALALLALQPAAGICLVEFCDYLGDDLKVSEVVARLGLVNQPFSRASALPRFCHAVIFGIMSAAGFLTLAPEPGRILQPTDRLILIKAPPEQAEGSMDLLESAISWTPGGRGCCSLLRSKIEPPQMLVKCKDRLRGIPFVRPVNKTPKVVIIIGWGPCIGSLLQSLDARLPKESKLYILSLASVEVRAQQLKADGIFQNEEGQWEGLGQVTIEHLVGMTTQQINLQRLPLEDASAVLVIGDSQDRGWQNAQITDSETIMTVEFLQQLRAQAELDSRKPEDERPKDEEMKEATKKSRTFKSKSAKTASTQASKALSSRFLVVPQFYDFLTFRMFQLDCDLLKTASSRDAIQVVPFHRNVIETGALAVSAQLPALGRALEAVAGLEVRVRGQPGVLRVSLEAIDVEDLLKPHERVENSNGNSGSKPVSTNGMSFVDLTARAAEMGRGVVLGWSRTNGRPEVYECKRRTAGEQAGITVNPREKRQSLMWYSGDKIIVMTAEDTRPAPADPTSTGPPQAIGATSHYTDTE